MIDIVIDFRFRSSLLIFVVNFRRHFHWFSFSASSSTFSVLSMIFVVGVCHWLTRTGVRTAQRSAWTNGLIRTDIHWYASQRSTITLAWITRTLRWSDWASTHRNALQLIGQVSDFLSPFLRGKKGKTYFVFRAPSPTCFIVFRSCSLRAGGTN